MPYSLPTAPLFELALDFLNAEQALRAAEEAVPAGITWIEAGTPLIKSEGLQVLRQLRQRFPEACLVGDLKTMDAGRVEVDAVHRSGADVAMVLAVASDATIKECVEAGKHLGIAIGADLVACPDPAQRAKEVEALGVDLVSVHTPIDQQMEGLDGFAVLKEVAAAVQIPISCAVAYRLPHPHRHRQRRHDCIVGGAIAKSPNNHWPPNPASKPWAVILPQARNSTNARALQKSVRFWPRSAPAISPTPCTVAELGRLQDRNPGKTLCGPAVTCSSTPGDWSSRSRPSTTAKKVMSWSSTPQAVAPPSGVALPPAAAMRKLGGVVIDGACRDLEEIIGSEVPVWSRSVTPAAGEPHGVGAIGGQVQAGGQTIKPGDWIVGDPSGLMVIPAAKIVEVANRAQDIMERSNVTPRKSTRDVPSPRSPSSRWEKQ